MGRDFRPSVVQTSAPWRQVADSSGSIEAVAYAINRADAGKHRVDRLDLRLQCFQAEVDFMVTGVAVVAVQAVVQPGA